MTTTNPAPVPPPGSDAAIAAGCTCPIWDNSYGYGYRVNFDDDGRVIARQFILAANCPIHDPLPDLHMRPRTGAGGAE